MTLTLKQARLNHTLHDDSIWRTYEPVIPKSFQALQGCGKRQNMSMRPLRPYCDLDIEAWWLSHLLWNLSKHGDYLCSNLKILPQADKYEETWFLADENWQMGKAPETPGQQPSHDLCRHGKWGTSQEIPTRQSGYSHTVADGLKNLQWKDFLNTNECDFLWHTIIYHFLHFFVRMNAI